MYLDGGSDGCGYTPACILPRNDLVGLVNEMNDLPGTMRWVGGSAHELGHALNLDDNKAGGLMDNEFYNYPNTFLTPDEINKLSN